MYDPIAERAGTYTSWGLDFEAHEWTVLPLPSSSVRTTNEIRVSAPQSYAVHLQLGVEAVLGLLVRNSGQPASFGFAKILSICVGDCLMTIESVSSEIVCSGG